jgi:hypothetical protein
MRQSAQKTMIIVWACALLACQANATPYITPTPLPHTTPSPTILAPIEGRLGQAFPLKVGQTASVKDEELTIRFDAVTDDSRCPVNVPCVWAGMARLALTMQQAAQPTTPLSVTTLYVDDGPERAFYLNYQVQVKALKPLRGERPFTPNDYEATLLMMMATVNCKSRDDDPQGYLLKICNYIKAKQLNVSPADPNNYHIKRVEERQQNNRTVLWIFLDCCFMGDIAVIDKASGEIIEFRVGPK